MTATIMARANIGIKLTSASSNVSSGRNITNLSATTFTTMPTRPSSIIGSRKRHFGSTRHRTGGFQNYHHHHHHHHHQEYFYCQYPTPMLERQLHQRHMHTIAARLTTSVPSTGCGGGGMNGNISSRQRQRQRQRQLQHPYLLGVSTRPCISKSLGVPAPAHGGLDRRAGRVRFQSSSSAASQVVHGQRREEDNEQHQQRVEPQKEQQDMQNHDEIKTDIKPATATTTAKTKPEAPEPEPEPEPLHETTTAYDNDSVAGSASASPSPSLHQQYYQQQQQQQQQHNDLASFHRHARRTGLSPSSTVYTGTCYEYLAQKTLRRYGFELSRVGGRGDRGVDLVGVWRVGNVNTAGSVSISRSGSRSNSTSDSNLVTNSRKQKQTQAQTEMNASTTTTMTTDNSDTTTTATPSTLSSSTSPMTLNVLVQCKRLTGKHAKIGPNLIRELDGAVRAARYSTFCINPDSISVSNSVPTLGPKGPKPTLGVLVGTRPATKGVVESMRRSNRGLVWIMMEEDQQIEEDIELEIGLEQEQLGNGVGKGEERNEGNEGEKEGVVPVRGIIKQILWNQAARDLGLEGVDVVKRILPSGKDEVVLMRSGGS
ncbi:hypothetical protein ABEF95_002926 [Exophiala dermatitidis]